MNRFALVLATAMLFATPLTAGDNFNKTGAAGEAIIATSQDMELYEQYHFSPAYRAGDFLFLSGVVAEAPGDSPATPEEYQVELHKAFSAIKATLDAAGARLRSGRKAHDLPRLRQPPFRRRQGRAHRRVHGGKG